MPIKYGPHEKGKAQVIKDDRLLEVIKGERRPNDARVMSIGKKKLTQLLGIKG